MINRQTYLRFAGTVQQYLHPIFESVLQGNLNDKGLLDIINKDEFIPNVLIAYNYYNCTQEQAECIFRLVYDYVLG
jgi:hypothetical protein